MKYTKKPVQIEAIQFTRNNWDEIKAFTNDTANSFSIGKGVNGKYTCIIPTLEGEHIASENDFIIKGIEGEFYPCKPDIFQKTYVQSLQPSTMGAEEVEKKKIDIRDIIDSIYAIEYKHRAVGSYQMADEMKKIKESVIQAMQTYAHQSQWVKVEDAKKQAIMFARYYISNKSIIELNKDNDNDIYAEFLAQQSK